jgi:hypothetical protein
MREGRRWMRAHADRRVSVVGVQDVRAVFRRGHPRGYDRAWRGQFTGAPRDVLAHFIAPTAARQIAARAHPIRGRIATGTHVVEVVLAAHVVAVVLRRRFQLRVFTQRALAVAFPFCVDQALHRGLDAGQVARRGHQVGVRAGRRRRRAGGKRGTAQEDRQRSEERGANASHVQRIGLCVGAHQLLQAILDGSWTQRARCNPPYSASSLPRISRMISSLPPPIGPRRASRAARSTQYSFM